MFRQWTVPKARAGAMRAAVAAVAVAAILLSASAAAASCLDQVRELAQRHDLSTVPPKASPDEGRGVTSDKLAQSGGVIKPPASPDKSVITPPPSSDRMQTMPDVKPSPKQSTKDDDAADRVSLQALLMAARDQAERGEEKQCLEGLDKARELLQRKP